MIQTATPTRRGLVFGGMAAAGAALAPLPAYAFNPASIATAVQVAQFALGAAKLFQGSSNNRATDVQLRLLINITKQIAIVQDGIGLILTRLDEIQSILNDIPAQVVNELTTRELRAKFGVYNELLRTFDLYNQDIRRFQREKGADTRRLVGEIQSARQVLFGFDNYASIPVLSAALHVEYECRRLLGQSDNDIIPMTEAYGAYFNRVMYTGPHNLMKRLADLRAERAKLTAEATQQRLVEGQIFPWGDYGFRWTKIGYAQHSLVRDSTVADVETLIAMGLVHLDERPITVTTAVPFRVPGSHITRTYADVTTGQYHGPHTTAGMPMWNDVVASNEGHRQTAETQINLNASRIYGAASCFHAGSRSLNFCQQFRI